MSWELKFYYINQTDMSNGTKKKVLAFLQGVIVGMVWAVIIVKLGLWMAVN